jgi:hypothetical protein
MEFLIYLFSIQPEEIQLINNYLVKNLRRKYKPIKDPSILLISLPEFKVLLVLSLFAEKIKKHEYNSTIENPPEDLMQPLHGFEKIYILEYNNHLSDVNVILKKNQ